MSLSLIELEQLNNSRFYNDALAVSAAAESGASFSDDFNYVLSQIKQLTGNTNWYDAPDATIAELAAASGVNPSVSADLTDIRTYIGMTQGDDTPNYSSINYVTQSGNLTQAIGELDAQVGTNASNISTNAGNISTNAGNISTNAGNIASNDTDIANLQSFVGAAPGDTAPTYSSTIYVTQSGSLEQAIGELDAVLNTIVGASGSWSVHYDAGLGILDMTNYDADIRMPNGRSWDFNNSAGANPIAEFTYGADVNGSQIYLRSLGHREFTVLGSTQTAGNTQTIPNSRTYTLDPDGRNLRVFRNGQLLLPGSGVTSGDEQYNDYRELSTTQIVNNETWRVNEIIQYVILG